ncbi:MAG: DUF1329 domain-containing protein [SAR324 cluster bacterium]|uniref:DUF1329 domain-containing protein n=1 Tax=SAR324 cluster bacterium TaxID=2024889 RepID=A0A7X9FTR9_9DELT|nr:DUF1329 domain-containing protein [SAR324 cluster bacterium]
MKVFTLALFFLSLILVVVEISGVDCAWGQGSSFGTEAPDLKGEDWRQLLESIPDATEQGSPRLQIANENAYAFRSIIAPEIYPFVKAGKLKMGVVRSLRYSLDSKEAKSSKDFQYLLNQELSATEEIELPKIIPFPEVFNAEALSKDPRAAEKILWNMIFRQSKQLFQKISLSFRSLTSENKGREINAELLRVYPLAIEAKIKTPQLFREILRFKDPPAYHSLAFLTFRFLNREEDLLWVFSPAISKTRQLTGTNRGDLLPGFSLGLEDLFGWSGNLRFVEASLTGVRQVLLPFTELDMLKLQKSSFVENNDICFELGSREVVPRQDLVELGLSEDNSDSLPWLPTNSVFVPRMTWRIEVAPKDPYSEAGRQVLYIDKDLLVPAINVVFDRAGKLWRIILSGFSQAKNEEKEISFLSFMSAFDVRTNKATVVNIKGVSYCENLPPNISLADFDPSSLGK